MQIGCFYILIYIMVMSIAFSVLSGGGKTIFIMICIIIIIRISMDIYKYKTAKEKSARKKSVKGKKY